MRLRVWWIPQVPMESFNAEVKNLREAKLLLTTLADYDIFQYENKVKPDYSNAGGLQYQDEATGVWFDWTDEEGTSIDDLTMEQCEELDGR